LGAAATQALSKLYRGEPAAFGADTGLTRSDAEPPALPAVLDDAKLAAAWAAFDEAQNLPGGARLDGRRFTVMEPASAETLASWRIHAVHALAGWGCADRALGAWPEALALRAAWSGPVSIVAGAQDACCDPLNAVRLAALWPQATLALVPGAGHRLDDPALAPVLAAAAHDFGTAIIAAPRSPHPRP
jgi:proline iminopeptidase